MSHGYGSPTNMANGNPMTPITTVTAIMNRIRRLALR
jgi:hypothetical protein